MKTKRFLSIALALVMLLGMLPGMSLTAFADGNTTTITSPATTGTMTITLTIPDPAPSASIDFLGGSLRRRAYKGTDTVIDFETDLRFGFSFELPEGAVVDTEKSYFRWKEGDEATAETGKKIAIKNVGYEKGKLVANMVITGVPKAAYQGDINCFVHLVYTLDNMEFVMEANKDSNGYAYTRSVEQVCKGLINNETWGAYAQSLLNAIS